MQSSHEFITFNQCRSKAKISITPLSLTNPAVKLDSLLYFENYHKIDTGLEDMELYVRGARLKLL